MSEKSLQLDEQARKIKTTSNVHAFWVGVEMRAWVLFSAWIASGNNKFLILEFNRLNTGVLFYF